MASEVRSAAEATKVATTFLKQYYGFLRPISAEKKNGSWNVKVDVGIVVQQIASIDIDASTGEVMQYSFPR